MRNKEALAFLYIKQQNEIYYTYFMCIGRWVKAQESFYQSLVSWKVLVNGNRLEICNVRFFNLPFQIALYTRVITATMVFLQFNFVVILRWY